MLLVWCFALLVACTENVDSIVEKETSEEEQALDALDVLWKEKKNEALVFCARQKMDSLQESSIGQAAGEAKYNYARKLFTFLFNGYFTDRSLIPAGIACMDSLGEHPFWKEACRYELPIAKAQLNQVAGNNETALHWAAVYEKLPECTDGTRFITQAEALSGVYMFCSNDVSKAISILERAVEEYRKGASYPGMIRLMSRLGSYYRLSGKYAEAVEMNQEAINSYNDSLPGSLVVIAYGEQGNLYAELDMYKQALEQNAIALHYSLQADSFGLGDLYRYRADIFSSMNRKDSVFYYLNRGEQASAAIHSFKGVIGNKIETIKAYLNYPDSLQRAVQLGLSICPDTLRIPKWAQYQLDLYLGQALQKTGSVQQGVSLLEKASRGFASMNMVNLEYETNRCLMSYYQEQRMGEEFMRCYTRNALFADSLHTDEKLRMVAASNIRFESERKEKENLLLAAQVEIQKKEVLGYGCASVTLLVLFVVSLCISVRKRKAHLLLVRENEQKIQKFIVTQRELNLRNQRLVEQIEKAEAKDKLAVIQQITVQSLLSKEDENAFRQSFSTVYPTYLPKLRAHYPQLTHNEELLAMLIRMNQNTDEIALIMGVNRSSVNVTRSRMRKNLNLSKEESLDELLKSF